MIVVIPAECGVTLYGGQAVPVPCGRCGRGKRWQLMSEGGDPVPEGATLDTSVAHPARVYDYWLLRHEALRYRVGVRDPRRQAVAAV